MLNISANTFKSLRDALLQCGPFESNQKLRAVFAHPSLLPWQAGLPEAENVVDRVDILIDYLKKAHLNTGEPVLPIFFRILAERYDPQNLCYRLLSDLARELDHSYASVKLSVNPPRPIDDRSYDHRLNKKIYDLQQQWELLNEKLNGFNEQWILETRVEEKLRLRKLVDDTKIQCDQVEEQLKEMERQLAKVDSDAQEAAGRNDDRGHDRPRSGDAPRGATQHPHKDFFVSYNGADRQWAEWIAWQLEAAGYTTVIQAWDFRPGSNFVLEMQKASEQAERTIAVLSPNYVQALYTQPEWAVAFAQDPTGAKRQLVPVRVKPCELKGLLAQIVYIDLVDLHAEAARDKLLTGVDYNRAKPAVAPGFPGPV